MATFAVQKLPQLSVIAACVYVRVHAAVMCSYHSRGARGGGLERGVMACGRESTIRRK